MQASSHITLALCTVGLLAARSEALVLGDDPRIDAADFRATVFASGLDFPASPIELPDGSILVGSSTGQGLFSSSGQLLRFVDADGDGSADSAGAVLASGLPGVITSVRIAGDLVLVSSADAAGRRISVLRRGVSESSPYVALGFVQLAFPLGWSHTSYSLAVEEKSAENYQVFFNVGSSANASDTSATATASGLFSGVLAGDAIYRVEMVDSGTGAPQFSGLTQIATGLRNAAGLAFDPASGDLWFEDNGIDTPMNLSEAFSADELNAIASNALGGAIEDFGFSAGYVTYRSGTVVGGGLQPQFAFQPIPDPATGAESEGPVEIAFAPPLFPAALRDGIFVGFHGQSTLGGLANEENPVVFADFASGDHLHFVVGQQVGLGHPNGILATHDSLFIADLSSNGSLSASGLGAGVIHQIKAIGPDADADGVVDVADNCPYAANANQSDVGGLGAGSVSDGIGDVCQCGDVTGNGVVTTADAVVITRSLLVPPTATQTEPSLCDVGGSSACSTADAVIVTRALLVPPTVSIQQVCQPAIP